MKAKESINVTNDNVNEETEKVNQESTTESLSSSQNQFISIKDLKNTNRPVIEVFLSCPEVGISGKVNIRATSARTLREIHSNRQIGEGIELVSSYLANNFLDDNLEPVASQNDWLELTPDQLFMVFNAIHDAVRKKDKQEKNV